MFPRISETEVPPPLNGATISAPVTRPTNRPRCAYSGQWSTGTCKQIEHRNPNLPGVPTDGHRVRESRDSGRSRSARHCHGPREHHPATTAEILDSTIVTRAE